MEEWVLVLRIVLVALGGLDGFLVTVGGRMCLPGGGFPVEDAGPLRSMVVVRGGVFLFFLGMVSTELTVVDVAAGSLVIGVVGSEVLAVEGLELFAGFVVLR